MDQFANIKSMNLDGLSSVEDIAAELCQPFDDLPQFDLRAAPEVNVNAHLSSDRRMIRTPRRRFMVDYRSHPDAYKHLDVLPGPGDSLHGVISGRYALFEIIPAIIERSGQSIDHLTVATLSFSKANAAELLGLLDTGHIGRVSLLVSYYFKSTNQDIYDSLIPELRRRGQKCLAMRTHCKIILAKMADGTCFTAESSANLRSSKNIEQFTLTNDVDLFNFHSGWIEGELMKDVEVDTRGRQ